MTSLSAPLPKLLSDKAKPTGLAQLPPPSPRLASPISPSRRPQQQTPSIAHPIGNDGTSLAFGGIRPPQNTPADGMLPISASKIQGSRRLIGQVGNGRGRGSLSHAITPGNTPSSLDRITRRIASNLLLDGQNQAPTQQKVQGRIAPSYERRFTAGLGDLNQKLQQTGPNRFNPPSPPNGQAGHPNAT